MWGGALACGIVLGVGSTLGKCGCGIPWRRGAVVGCSVVTSSLFGYGVAALLRCPRSSCTCVLSCVGASCVVCGGLPGTVCSVLVAGCSGGGISSTRCLNWGTILLPPGSLLGISVSSLGASVVTSGVGGGR